MYVYVCKDSAAPAHARYLCMYACKDSAAPAQKNIIYYYYHRHIYINNQSRQSSQSQSIIHQLDYNTHTLTLSSYLVRNRARERNTTLLVTLWYRRQAAAHAHAQTHYKTVFIFILQASN